MRDEEDASRQPDAENGVAADGAFTLHAPQDATPGGNGSGFRADSRYPREASATPATADRGESGPPGPAGSP
ncbi:hypothetical protein GCM10018783_38330 [Streptomyces griseosporeus]|nr:hypothetical protein GCM10018783_38330 [Streptomyces griseosporeus]